MTTIDPDTRTLAALDFPISCGGPGHADGSPGHGGYATHLITATCGNGGFLCMEMVNTLLAFGHVSCFCAASVHPLAEVRFTPIAGVR